MTTQAQKQTVTKEQEPPQKSPLDQAIDATRPVEYTPFGEKTPVRITIEQVRKYLCSPTKKGCKPSDADVINYMMLCKSRELNPWVGDAYLVGYDSSDGPSFSLITAVQALHKRAEVNPEYDGLEAGITVVNKDGEIIRREGCLKLSGETVVAGWARVYRKDRAKPFYAEPEFSVFNSGMSRWKKDPQGMIRKVAIAAALREAFPTQLGGLYVEGERRDDDPGVEHTNGRAASTESSLDALAARLGGGSSAPSEGMPQPHKGPPEENSGKSPDVCLAPSGRPGDSPRASGAPSKPPAQESFSLSSAPADKPGSGPVEYWRKKFSTCKTRAELDAAFAEAKRDDRIGDQEFLLVESKYMERAELFPPEK